jgi:beta-glucosidase
MLGRYPQHVVEWLGEPWPPLRDGDLEVISTAIDFVGVTYYFGQLVSDASDAGGALPGAGGDAELFDSAVGSLGTMLKARMAPASDRQTSLGWPIYPEGATRVLKWISDRYGNPPIIVTENGVAFDDQVVDGRVDDGERIDYLRDHFIAAHLAIDQGVDLRGWYVWALLDTWEFSLGFKGRFGLIHVDYDTLARTIKRSGRWFAEVMANNGLEGP